MKKGCFGEISSEKSIDFFELSVEMSRGSVFFVALSIPRDNTDVSLFARIFSYSNRIFSVVNSSGKIKSISIGYFIHQTQKWCCQLFSVTSISNATSKVELSINSRVRLNPCF